MRSAESMWAGDEYAYMREMESRLAALEVLRCDRTARNVDEWLDGILKRLDALEAALALARDLERRGSRPEGSK